MTQQVVTSMVDRALTQPVWNAVRARVPALARRLMPLQVPADRNKARRALHRALWERRRLPPFLVPPKVPPGFRLVPTDGPPPQRPTFNLATEVTPRATWRFLSPTEREDLVWFFRYSGGDIAHVVSIAGIAMDKAPAEDVTATELAVRLSAGHAAVEFSDAPPDFPGESDTDADDHRVFATRRARRVQAAVESLLAMPGGPDHAFTLFDAYMSPGLIRGSGAPDGIPTVHPHGALLGKEGEERTPAMEVFRLKSGAVIRARDHLPVEPADGIPGIVAREGDGSRDVAYRSELQEACNAYRRAVYAIDKAGER